MSCKYKHLQNIYKLKIINRKQGIKEVNRWYKNQYLGE